MSRRTLVQAITVTLLALGTLGLVAARGDAADVRAAATGDALVSTLEERYAFEQKVIALVDAKERTAIEALAADLRRDRSRFSDGWPMLERLYRALGELPSRSLVEDWYQAQPVSPTAFVARTTTQLREIWDRGGFLGAAGFRRGREGQHSAMSPELKTAWTLLNAPAGDAARDPELYVTRYRAGLMLTRSRAEMDRVLGAGLAVDPDYLPLFDIALHDRLWRREPADEVLTWMEAQSRRRGGAARYAELFTLLVRERPHEPWSAYLRSWGRVRRGYEALTRARGRSSLHWNAFLFGACEAGDRKTARRLAARLRDHWSSDSEAVWKKERFQKCVAWAQGEGDWIPEPLPLESSVDLTQRMQGRVSTLLLNEQFDELEAMADRLRRERTRNVAGLPELYEFYNSVRGAGSVVRPHVDRWLEAHPRSVTARVFKAKALSDENWRYGRPSAALLAEEHRVLLEAERLDLSERHRDPMIYNGLIGVGLDGISPEETEAVLRRGLEVDPDFDDLYFSYAVYVRPLAYGSVTELAAFAKRAGDARGDLLYARIVSFVAQQERDAFEPAEFSWPRIKKGYAEILSRYSRSSRNWSAYLWLACRYGDDAAAAVASARLGGQWWPDAEAMWPRRIGFDQCVARSDRTKVAPTPAP
jgi:hypothetical protein